MRNTITVLLMAALAGCKRDAPPDRARLETAITPAELASGESLYGLHCQRCHGPRATGAAQGPPLVDPVYRPAHHADAAFLIAAQRGVAAHHWTFGNMPPVPGVTADDVAAITGYVRWLQRAAGIE